MARVAIVLADGFADRDLEVALERVAAAGHESVVVGSERAAMITGAGGSTEHVVEATPEQVVINDLDALVVPGGTGVDLLKADDRVVSLCKHMAMADKPIALSGHGGSLLAGTRVLDGRTMTSPGGDRAELEAAGVTWVDEPIVTDGNLLSAAGDGQVEPLCDALLDRLDS